MLKETAKSLIFSVKPKVETIIIVITEFCKAKFGDKGDDISYYVEDFYMEKGWEPTIELTKLRQEYEDEK